MRRIDLIVDVIKESSTQNSIYVTGMLLHNAKRVQARVCGAHNGFGYNWKFDSHISLVCCDSMRYFRFTSLIHFAVSTAYSRISCFRYVQLQFCLADNVGHLRSARLVR